MTPPWNQLGTVLDATLISAPSSSQNTSSESRQEMDQSMDKRRTPHADARDQGAHKRPDRCDHIELIGFAAIKALPQHEAFAHALERRLAP